ncbi:MAG: MaoC family dehydratase [Gammaproteobacteria bacterium]|nr:MaoC family dehydratase [Gammaproteobacteria bacterium]
MSRVFEHPKDLLDAVGETLGPTDWMTVEQDRINQFADATDDHQWIHVDPEKAADGPFGATIAHGFLTLSLVNKFLPKLFEVQNTTMGVNYGCDKVRFPNTVKVNQQIRGRGEILGVEEKPGAVQVTVRVSVEVEGEERPACVADTISRFYYSD